MDICGIVAEYNPFHNGHALQIHETRKLLPPQSAIISVMSGNFVQRGDFAIQDKYMRAKAAVLSGGPDLVLELPLTRALASAEGFAEGGISILAACGCVTHLSFGSECGDLTALQKLADFLLSSEFDACIRKELTSGISYAAARQKVADRQIPGCAALLQSPNNTLGIEYLKALKKCGARVSPLTIKRAGAQHDSTDSSESVASASHLRHLLQKAEADRCADFMPSASFSLLSQHKKVNLQQSESAMLSYFRRLTQADFAALPDASEGLEFRLQHAAYSASTLTELYEHAKTKRYALSRIRRMVLCAYLGITSEIQSLPPQYIRVLAMNDIGRAVLKTMKITCSLPVIIKPLKEKYLKGDAKRLSELDCLADDLYHLPSPGGIHWRQTPFFLSPSP